MTYELDAEGIARLEEYFEGIGTRLGEKRRRASFALYAMGILGEHERKSVEPLAAAAADDPEGAQRTHDHLLHLIGQSESWTSDRTRCDRAKIPRDVEFRTKWQIALEMMERAVKTGLPKGIALADAAYGNVGEFRAGLRWLDFEYAVGVNATTVVTRVSKASSNSPLPTSVEALARQLPRRAFRPTLWRQGSRRALVSRFAMVKVDAGNADGGEHWLLIELPDNEKAPTHYTLARLSKAASRKQLVRITKERWRTERVYEDLKGELGLDHFEGRSFRGWNHHVTVVLCCYAFVGGS